MTKTKCDWEPKKKAGPRQGWVEELKQTIKDLEKQNHLLDSKTKTSPEGKGEKEENASLRLANIEIEKENDELRLANIEIERENASLRLDNIEIERENDELREQIKRMEFEKNGNDETRWKIYELHSHFEGTTMLFP